MKPQSFRELFEKRPYAKSLKMGDIAWRSAILHAEEGLILYDCDCRPLNITIGIKTVVGFAVHVLSGDLERLGVLPPIATCDGERITDKALRVCHKWMKNDNKPEEFLGLRVMVDGPPPVGWTHIIIDRVENIPLSATSYYRKYEGRWCSDPQALCDRYKQMTLQDLSKQRSAQSVLAIPQFRERIESLFDVDQVRKALGINSQPISGEIVQADTNEEAVPNADVSMQEQRL